MVLYVGNLTIYTTKISLTVYLAISYLFVFTYVFTIEHPPRSPTYRSCFLAEVNIRQTRLSAFYRIIRF